MQAITFDRYGGPDVLRLEEVPPPAATRPDDVRVRVRAAGANPYDWHFMEGKPYLMRLMLGGLRRPAFRRLGGDLAGEVEAVGAGVTRFRPGDAVFGQVRGAVEGELELALGAFAETVCTGEDFLAPKPANLTFEQAAGVCLAGLTALNGLRTPGTIGPGSSVLINGASGGVGTFAVQLAKAMGAAVTGVCSTRNVALVRSLGADHVIDYTREDFTRSEARHDLLFDCVGNRPPRACLRAVKPTGTYLLCFGRPERAWLGPLPELLGARLLAPFVKPRLVGLDWRFRGEDLRHLASLLEAGTITAIVDRSYPLREAGAAMGHLGQGHARGKVIVTP